MLRQQRVFERPSCLFNQLLPFRPIHLLYLPYCSFAPKQATIARHKEMHIFEIPDLEKKKPYPQFSSIFRICRYAFFPLQKNLQNAHAFFVVQKMCVHNKNYSFFQKTDDMHFLGWPGSWKTCIFSRKMHVFSGSRAGKKCISAISRKFGYAFFWVAWILQNMHFLKENACFSGSRAGKKMHISIFFQKIMEIPPICIFSRKMHVFVAQTLTQKMHEHLWCFFGGGKNAHWTFLENWRKLRICILFEVWNLKNMHFLDENASVFSILGWKKKHIHNFHLQNWGNSKNLLVFKDSCSW